MRTLGIYTNGETKEAKENGSCRKCSAAIRHLEMICDECFQKADRMRQLDKYADYARWSLLLVAGMVASFFYIYSIAGRY